MPMTALAVAGGLGAASSVAGTVIQGGEAGTAEGLAQTTASEQQYYNKQLMSLISNPQSFMSTPMFQATQSEAAQGLAAQGYTGSTNMGLGLQANAYSELLSQEQLLGQLSGVEAASSPAQSLSVAAGSTNNSLQTLSGLMGSLAFLGGSGALSGLGGSNYGGWGTNAAAAAGNQVLAGW